MFMVGLIEFFMVSFTIEFCVVVIEVYEYLYVLMRDFFLEYYV